MDAVRFRGGYKPTSAAARKSKCAASGCRAKSVQAIGFAFGFHGVCAVHWKQFREEMGQGGLYR